jgi:hypothetical protein
MLFLVIRYINRKPIMAGRVHRIEARRQSLTLHQQQSALPGGARKGEKKQSSM